MASEYQRIPEAEYRKLAFQLRGQFSAILNVFNCYGMNSDVLQAIEECVRVTENFGMAVRGKDKPIHILNKPKPRAIDTGYRDMSNPAYAGTQQGVGFVLDPKEI